MVQRTSGRGRSRTAARGVLAALGVAVLVGACSSGGGTATTAPSAAATAKPETTFEKIKREKVVRVGFVNEAPFAYSTMEKLTGEAPEVLRVILAKAGVERMEGVLTEFASLIPALVSNRIDIIGAGMFVRPARCEQIDFGNPEYQIGEGLAVKKGNPKGLTKLQDFVDKKAKIGLVTGGAEVEYADIAKIDKSLQVLFPDGPTAIAGLQAGQVDAVMLTTLSIQDLIKKAGDPNIEYASMSEQPKDKDGNPAVGWGAMGFRQVDDDLRAFYNDELAKLQASGELLKIQEPFGLTKEEQTTKKATEICPNIK